MQVFELHFNPKNKPGTKVDSFCYEAENAYEKRLGNLYLIGQVSTLANKRLMDNLVKVLKTKYYSYLTQSPGIALRQSLKAGNKFLADLVQKGDVNWMGNLDLATLAIKESNKGRNLSFNLNFNKVGQIKIFLIRDNHVMEIGKELEAQDINPYPLKVFFNTASGNLKEGDKIMVFTRNLFDNGQEIIKSIASVKKITQRVLKDVLPKEKIEELFGTCLIISFQKELLANKLLTFQQQGLKFSFADAFNPIQGLIKKPLNLAKQSIVRPFAKITSFKPLLLTKSKKSSKPKKVEPVIKKERVSLIQSLRIIIDSWRFRKVVVLVLTMAIILVIGFFIFQGERIESAEMTRQALARAQTKVTRAQSLLILEEINQANQLFQEAWYDISPLANVGFALEQELNQLKTIIEDNLVELNNLAVIEEPDFIFEFDTHEIKLLPQQMLLAGDSLYFFNPLAKIIYKLNPDSGNGTPLLFSDEYRLASNLNDSLLFFKRPDTIAAFFQNEISFHSLSSVSADTNMDLMACFSAGFNSAIYFLDSLAGKIIKYPINGQGASMEIGLGQAWLKNPDVENHYLINAKSLAIDGSLWFISDRGAILRFYAGEYEDILEPAFFPILERPTKLFTSSTHLNLYVLEPSAHRVLILNKGGGIIKQFQSEKFDNLLDIAVSSDEKTLFLLNGLKVYQIQL